MRPNWIEVSRSALLKNYEEVRGRMARGSRMCAVVKADAYGHGAAFCAQTLAAAGVEWFGVTSAEEGALLRAAGIRGRILVMGGFCAADADLLVEQQLTPAVWDEAHLHWLGAALRRRDVADGFAVHLKLDSGMGRLGLLPAQEESFCSRLHRFPHLQIEAMFSHLSSADIEDATTSRCQRLCFAAARQRLGAMLPSSRPFWHLLNSSGLFRFADWGGDLVRPGLCLYGYVLGADAGRLRPVLTWKTRIISLKDLPAGAPVGYGERYRTTRPSRVAVLAVGYADGYHRDFADGRVLVHGRSAPVIGNISMDLTTIDVTEIPQARLGDEVVLLGGPVCGMENGTVQPIDAAELAALAGTIPYEVLCGITHRVERRTVE
jgi:alanine racemase